MYIMKKFVKTIYGSLAVASLICAAMGCENTDFQTPPVVVEKYKLYYDALGGSADVAISGTISGIKSSDDTWLTAVKTDNKVVVTAKDFAGNESAKRTGIITLMNGDFIQEIPVTQDFPIFKISTLNATLYVKGIGSSFKYSIVGNRNGGYTSTEPTWLKGSLTMDFTKGTGSFTGTVSANKGTEARNALIKVYGIAEKPLTDTAFYTIRQYITPIVESLPKASKDTVNVVKDATTITLTASNFDKLSAAGMSIKAAKLDAATAKWITVDAPVNGTITFHINANLHEQKRSGKISLVACVENGGKVVLEDAVTFLVIQKATTYND